MKPESTQSVSGDCTEYLMTVREFLRYGVMLSNISFVLSFDETISKIAILIRGVINFSIVYDDCYISNDARCLSLYLEN